MLAAAITGVVYLVRGGQKASRGICPDGSQLPINFVLPDILPLLNVASLQPMPLLYQTVTGSTPAAIGLLFLSMSIPDFSSTPWLNMPASPRHLGFRHDRLVDGRVEVHMGV